VLGHPAFVELATRLDVTPAQLVFAFAHAVGMLPLTGTSSSEHMRQDLASLQIAIPADVVRALESMGG